MCLNSKMKGKKYIKKGQLFILAEFLKPFMKMIFMYSFHPEIINSKSLYRVIRCICLIIQVLRTGKLNSTTAQFLRNVQSSSNKIDFWKDPAPGR